VALPDKGGSGTVGIVEPGTTNARLVIPQGGSPLAGAPPATLPLEAGASQAEVNRILLAAPADLAAEATVIQWKPDFSYDTLRKGRNDLVCYDLSGRPAHPPFAAECTSLANIGRVTQTLKIEAMGSQAPAMFSAAEENGTRVKPQFGSIWYDLAGLHRWDAQPHVTIAIPGATMRTLRLPESGNTDGACLVLPSDRPAAVSTVH
jgi:hypothetical protein